MFSSGAYRRNSARNVASGAGGLLGFLDKVETDKIAVASSQDNNRNVSARERQFSFWLV